MTQDFQKKVGSMVTVDAGASFPVLLFRMLTDIEELGKRDPEMKKLQEIVSWQDHGRAFKIHDRKQFATIVVPTFFIRIKYSSFVRVLNAYNFKRINQDGPDKGGKQTEITNLIFCLDIHLNLTNSCHSLRSFQPFTMRTLFVECPSLQRVSRRSRKPRRP